MIRAPRRLTLAALAAALAVACGPADGPADGECGDLVPGDLVVTEVMANPAGDDVGNEWFELYNASSATLELSGAELVATKLDGTGEKRHAIDALAVAAGDYVVVGGVLPELKPAWIDHGYGGDLGSLVNGGGVLALTCGATEIDRLEYPEAPGSEGGVTTILDGNLVPDNQANDDLANLCASTAAFAAATDVIGSPGDANEACETTVPGTCDDGGTARAVVSPGVGDLVISEIMPSPSVDDADGEWFEVHALATVDLNGVVAGRTIGTPQASITSPACVTIAAGSDILFARSDDPAANGGLPEVDATFTFGLVGGSEASPGTLFVGVGDVVLDQISWTTSEDGASTALRPDQLDPIANDDPSHYVTCEVAYGTGGDLGTPGAPNDTCALPEGMCLDGGELRAIVAPIAGDLIVTEAMANPVGDPEAPQEWFEIAATADVDLNGLELGKVSDPYTVVETVVSADCIEVASGEHVVFAHGDVSGTNGGLPAGVRLFDMGLTNSNSEVFVGHGGALLSRLAWTTTRNATARARDPEEDVVCDAEVAYGEAGNLGSPGAANPVSTTQCVAQ